MQKLATRMCSDWGMTRMFVGALSHADTMENFDLSSFFVGVGQLIVAMCERTPIAAEAEPKLLNSIVFV